jgi:hypothetical protein
MVDIVVYHAGVDEIAALIEPWIVPIPDPIEDE